MDWNELRTGLWRPILEDENGKPLADLGLLAKPTRLAIIPWLLVFFMVIKVIFDLMVVMFLDRYLVKPIYVFGEFGVCALLLGGISFVYLIALKLFANISMTSTPLPLVTVMAVLTGVSSILMGLLAEILVCTYFESQQRTNYMVRERINFESAE
jgi:hypothetical protein